MTTTPYVHALALSGALPHPQSGGERSCVLEEWLWREGRRLGVGLFLLTFKILLILAGLPKILLAKKKKIPPTTRKTPKSHKGKAEVSARQRIFTVNTMSLFFISFIQHTDLLPGCVCVCYFSFQAHTESIEMALRQRKTSLKRGEECVTSPLRSLIMQSVYLWKHLHHHEWSFSTPHDSESKHFCYPRIRR